ncbi:UDP-glucose 6-dehydrogenase [Halopseudomonas pachastrellae]|uniref:UDP-glucose 6-dehydrogenase n=1 Tax=Halopseudomonas pachastrellae TaxID=254161 RepID=A0A1S8DJC3_9GAMM|nr:UDP-glucose/GDP-mannose dehydrogenase family protein [Halopseudomonas pachastrellae]ONM44969.1 UDP-glucose 6-dehydrogenase [Halopseudomonas pachastrellae]SFM19822.1 UDPglucose 6-dehydrogenase [Halopseudomonas pachastrellae]
MQITVIGCGYVGLVTATCFAEMGNRVSCVDTSTQRINALQRGEAPIFEPGIEALITTNLRAGRLAFSTDTAGACSRAEVIFIAVGTPSAADGSADISQIVAVASELGRTLDQPAIVVCKSTAPVGTACRVQSVLDHQCQRRQVAWQHRVVSNPEFLKEGAAIDDFMRPDRVVLGTDDADAERVMRALYEPFVRNHDRILCMSRRAAEMTKYAANTFLATRISFINEIASLCEQLGVDVEEVRKGIGSDQRIGHHFIYAGCGYGGSCFPKDIRAMLQMAAQYDMPMPILHSVEARNQQQKTWPLRMLKRELGNLHGRTLAIWGLAFKPGTDDIRDAPSLVLLDALLAGGSSVQAFDPAASDNIAQRYPEAVKEGQLKLLQDPYAALNNADALVLLTEWKQFRQPDFHLVAQRLRTPLVIDGRNQYDPQTMASLGLRHVGVGRQVAPPAAPVLREVV